MDKFSVFIPFPFSVGDYFRYVGAIGLIYPDANDKKRIVSRLIELENMPKIHGEICLKIDFWIPCNMSAARICSVDCKAILDSFRIAKLYDNDCNVRQLKVTTHKTEKNNGKCRIQVTEFCEREAVEI